MPSKYPKILLLAGWYPHSLNTSDGDFIKYQAKMLHGCGIQIDVFHASLSYKYLLKGQLRKKYFSRTTDTMTEYLVEGPFWPRNTKWSMKQWARVFYNDCMDLISEKGPYDLIHAHTYLGGIIAEKVKTEIGIPYIVTLHETSILENNEPLHHKSFIKKALHHAEKVVCVGRALSSTVKKKYAIDSLVIPNFIDTNLFKPSLSKNDTFTFVCIGDLIPRKNLVMLIEAFSIVIKSSQARLLFIGDGPERQSLESLSIKLGLADTINFVGQLSQKEVASHLSKCHCLVHPSHLETFGIVIIESLSCGIPVISTYSGGPDDIINEDLGVLLKYSDKVRLVESMIQILKCCNDYDPDYLRQYVKNHYSSKKGAESYLNLYLRILEKAK